MKSIARLVSWLWYLIAPKEAIQQKVRQPLPPLPEWSEGDWYILECRLFRSDPTAFWFDHDRYKDTPMQWPDPPAWALKKAWQESLAEAETIYGTEAIAELKQKMRPGFKHPEPSNPIPFLMKHFDVKPSKGRYQTPG